MQPDYICTLSHGHSKPAYIESTAACSSEFETCSYVWTRKIDVRLETIAVIMNV